MSAVPRPHVPGSWRSCPVALHAIAIASDESQQAVIDWISPETPFRTEVTLRRPVDEHLALWVGVLDIKLRMGIDGDLACEIVFADPDVKFEAGRMKFVHVLPATVASTFAHAPVREMVNHPLFTGISFDIPEDHDEYASFPIGPQSVFIASAYAFHPGKDYVALARTRLDALKG